MKVLLHICCGVCAAGVAGRLMDEGHSVVGYFYNPNIHPEEEYIRRLEAAREVAERVGFELIEGEYDPEVWHDAVKGLEDEPEGGERCEKCFRMRLGRGNDYLRNVRGNDIFRNGLGNNIFRNGLDRSVHFDMFATTLTVSPHKRAEVVNRVGVEVGGDMFLCEDFKKNEGFKKTVELAKEWRLYRQKYCGCKHSM